jgi:exodeoxyribonuclease III
MRLVTWNVNGLRSVLTKGALSWIHQEELDLLCLQEIKTRPDQLSTEQHSYFQDYHAYWNPAVRPGYSGVASFSRIEPQLVRTGIGLAEFDIEGRVIETRYNDLVVLNIYFPSGQRGYERVKYKLDFYSGLLDLCDRYHRAGDHLVLCGDFNTAHQEIDLRYPRQNMKTSGFLPEERAWVDAYLTHGFVDVYRWRYPERVQYTWWTYRLDARQRAIGWRLDYFLVSEAIVERVKDVQILDHILGSDHCPVLLEIN